MKTPDFDVLKAIEALPSFFFCNNLIGQGCLACRWCPKRNADAYSSVLGRVFAGLPYATDIVGDITQRVLLVVEALLENPAGGP